MLCSKNKNIFIQDTNWFGGTWTISDFLRAEAQLDKFLQKQKNLSPFERWISNYIFASNRPYVSAPKGSPFQLSRSYVDVLNGSFCVCVGYATIFKRLNDKSGIPCAVQGLLVKDKNCRTVNHANNLSYLKDEKYDIDGLFYGDARMDCQGFVSLPAHPKMQKLNSLAIPMTEIGRILIKAWQDDSIVEMNDFQSIYYSQTPTASDLKYFAKFFDFKDTQNILKAKYCKKITLQKILLALKNLGFDEDVIEQTKAGFSERNKVFFDKNFQDLEAKSEWQARLKFAEYLVDFLKHQGRRNDQLDCATFVCHIFKNFFDKNLLEGGIGGSWTGKIMSSSQGNLMTMDESKTLKEKLNFIDTKCKIGDVLFFHRQSKDANSPSPENHYPGHCGIYLGNHQYADARLTTRGNAAIVDIENDAYMQLLVGAKDFIHCFVKQEPQKPAPQKSRAEGKAR